MAEEFEGKVTFFGVSNNDTVEDGIGYADEFGVPYELAHGPDVWEAYGVPYQPVTIVIGADGAIDARVDGEISYDGLKEILEQQI